MFGETTIPDDDGERIAILWDGEDKLQGEEIAKTLANRLNCKYGCNNPYKIGGDFVVN